MNEEQACELAFEQFIKNHEVFLTLSDFKKPELACEMILLEICSAMYLLDSHSRKLFFEDIQRINEKITDERFEDEEDFLDCVGETMHEIRKKYED